MIRWRRADSFFKFVVKTSDAAMDFHHRRPPFRCGGALLP
jgi:hypothetical protein